MAGLVPIRISDSAGQEKTGQDTGLVVRQDIGTESGIHAGMLPKPPSPLENPGSHVLHGRYLPATGKAI